MDKSKSPFVPGLKVAVRPHPRYGVEPDRWVEREVLKVHKNFNFTLADNGKRIFRPENNEKGWEAYQTGSDAFGFNGDVVIPWEANAERIRVDNARYERVHMFRKVRNFWKDASFDSVDMPLVEQSTLALDHFIERKKLKAEK